MGYYGVTTSENTAANFFAGEFPVVTEIATADAAINKYTPVAETETGVAAVTTETIGNIVGIVADEAGQGEPVAYYMTGEFFEEALNIPDGVDAKTLKKALRKISIYLK